MDPESAPGTSEAEWAFLGWVEYNGQPLEGL
jgi:hypothetical protein